MEKVSLYKFTYTPLLKNDDQLKQKSDTQKKKNHPIYYNIKIMSPKKSHVWLNKKNKKPSHPQLMKSKKRKRERKIK